MKKKNILVNIVSNFPYGTAENFLETEIQYYKSFQKVYLCPIGYESSIKAMGMRKVPENIEIIRCKKVRTSIKINCYNYFLKEFYKEYIYILSHFKYKDISNIMKRMYSFYNKSVECVKQIVLELDRRNIKRSDNIIFYSYWMQEHALIAVFLKKVYKNSFAITRCHEYDLYKESAENKYLPFRYTIFKKIDYICPISQDGAIYLKKNWKINKSKIKVFRLGTLNNKAADAFKIQSIKKKILIVSCSYVVKEKRVNRIVEVLMKIKDIDILWYHFGDGNDMKKIKKMVEMFPSNIHCYLCGHLDNYKVLEFYNNYHPDLFIHLSEREGIPVAIMEACSEGIPIIATNVGGTKEIVKDGYNGYLVNKNFTNEEIIELIYKYNDFSNLKKNKFRSHAKNMWRKRFEAEKNYVEFISWLSK